jgi:hypothetical protein
MYGKETNRAKFRELRFCKLLVVKPRYTFDTGQSVEGAEACNLVGINDSANNKEYPG